MTYAVLTPDGEQVPLLDLPLTVLEEIEQQSGQTWIYVQTQPAATIKSALAVYRGVCKWKGIEPDPDLTADDLLSQRIIKPIESDLPDYYEEGLPKAEGDPPTSGSSGEQSSSDGHQT